MNRRFWKSHDGDPWSVMEVAVWQITASLITAASAILATASVDAGLVIGATVYMLISRVLVIVDWARGIRDARRADARTLAALNAVSGRRRTGVHG